MKKMSQTCCLFLRTTAFTAVTFYCPQDGNSHLQQLVQLLRALRQANAVSTVNNVDQSISAVKVVTPAGQGQEQRSQRMLKQVSGMRSPQAWCAFAPVRANGLLTTNIPDAEVEAVFLQGLDVETLHAQANVAQGWCEARSCMGHAPAIHELGS